MKELKIATLIKVYEYDELSPVDRQLVDAAKMATKNSYTPYSKFNVGAAILLDNGEIITGSNQENAAFPSGTCAERTACFYASTRFPNVPMKKIAVAAWVGKCEGIDPMTLPEEDYDKYFQAHPISPCGACRQSLLEYESRFGDVEVILYGRSAIYVLPSISSLLPLSFTEF